nr:hypothetical protein [Tanacetum cinerariifolium]
SNEEEQGNADTIAEEPVTADDDFVDQSIQSPTPLTPEPQQPQDIPSTSLVQSPPPQQQSSPPAPAQVILPWLDTSSIIVSADDSILWDVPTFLNRLSFTVFTLFALSSFFTLDFSFRISRS